MIADKNYLLTREGRAVEESDPAGVSVLVSAGGYIDDAEAEKYGVTGQASTREEHAAYSAQQQEEANLATISDPRLRAALTAAPKTAIMAGDGTRAVMIADGPAQADAESIAASVPDSEPTSRRRRASEDKPGE